MKKFAVVFSFITAMSSVQADSCDIVQDKLQKAIQYYESSGKEAAFDNFSNRNSEWSDPMTPLMVLNRDGIVRAYGYNPKLVDNPDVPTFKDVNGVLFIQEIIKKAKVERSGWVNYTWTNPKTKKLVPVRAFVKSFDKLVFTINCYPDSF